MDAHNVPKSNHKCNPNRSPNPNPNPNHKCSKLVLLTTNVRSWCQMVLIVKICATKNKIMIYVRRFATTARDFLNSNKLPERDANVPYLSHAYILHLFYDNRCVQ